MTMSYDRTKGFGELQYNPQLLMEVTRYEFVGIYSSMFPSTQSQNIFGPILCWRPGSCTVSCVRRDEDNTNGQMESGMGRIVHIRFGCDFGLFVRQPSPCDSSIRI